MNIEIGVTEAIYAGMFVVGYFLGAIRRSFRPPTKEDMKLKTLSALCARPQAVRGGYYGAEDRAIYESAILEGQAERVWVESEAGESTSREEYYTITDAGRAWLASKA
jgi:hypothetical protein